MMASNTLFIITYSSITFDEILSVEVSKTRSNLRARFLMLTGVCVCVCVQCIYIYIHTLAQCVCEGG